MTRFPSSAGRGTDSLTLMTGTRPCFIIFYYAKLCDGISKYCIYRCDLFCFYCRFSDNFECVYNPFGLISDIGWVMAAFCMRYVVCLVQEDISNSVFTLFLKPRPGAQKHAKCSVGTTNIPCTQAQKCQQHYHTTKLPYFSFALFLWAGLI